MKNQTKQENSKSCGWIKRFIHRLQHLPVALTGLALGLCGIGAILDTIAQQAGAYSSTEWWISIPFITIAVFLVTLVTIRNIAHPSVFKFDTKDPLLVSFIPTYSMTLMCFAGFIAGWQKHLTPTIYPCQVIGAVLMCIAVAAQLFFIVYFLIMLSKHRWNEDSMYGSWLVPTVGPITACTFASRFNELVLPFGFFQAIWFAAFATYVVLFVFVTYALLFKKQPDKEKFPSIAVYFAPANLTLAGFLQTFAIPSVVKYTDSGYQMPVEIQAFIGNDYKFINVMLILLTCMAFTYTILLWFFTVRIFLNNKFAYIFASLTFPLAIGASAMFYDYIYLKNYEIVNHAVDLGIIKEFFQYVGWIFTGVATCIIIFVAVRFLMMVFVAICSCENDDKKHQCYCDKSKKIEHVKFEKTVEAKNETK